MTRSELLSRIDSEELTEWMGLWQLRHEEHEKAVEEQKRERAMRGPRRR